jgi:hypothetical protein
VRARLARLQKEAGTNPVFQNSAAYEMERRGRRNSRRAE